MSRRQQSLVRLHPLKALSWIKLAHTTLEVLLKEVVPSKLVSVPVAGVANVKPQPPQMDVNPMSVGARPRRISFEFTGFGNDVTRRTPSVGQDLPSKSTRTPLARMLIDPHSA